MPPAENQIQQNIGKLLQHMKQAETWQEAVDKKLADIKDQMPTYASNEDLEALQAAHYGLETDFGGWKGKMTATLSVISIVIASAVSFAWDRILSR